MQRNETATLSRRASSSARSLRACLLLLSGLASGAPAAAQAPRLLVSTTSDVASLGAEDGEVLAVGGGAAPARALTNAHFRALAGVSPADVDALALRPSTVAGSACELVFSMLSNEFGFLDGDLLGLAPGGGFEVVVGEDELALALGVTGTGLDVDAAAFDAQGRLVFSLQADAAGTALGDLADGDVLRREADGSVVRLFTEAEVETLVAATGAVGAIADVQGLHYEGDELWVLVQSPSSHDGAVLALGANARVVLDEAQVGLGGAELNALLGPDTLPRTRFTIQQDAAQPGDVLTAEFAGVPGDTVLVLWSGSVSTVQFPALPGFGRLYLDPVDPWFVQGTGYLPRVDLDGAGVASITYTLPPTVAGAGFAAEQGWSFQALSVATLELSAPVRVAN